MIELCRPNKKVTDIISNVSELVISPKWGSCSEVSFRIYKKIDGKENPCYKKVKKTKLIHIEGFGYFTIVSDDESFDDKIPNKEIKAYSAEYLLNNKGINLTFITTAGNINNTDSTTIVTSNYFFYSEFQPEKSLLHQLIKAAPQWKIGYVSSSLRDESRSFSQSDKGLYGFLTNEVSQSYEALFVFDNENYTINAYDTTEIVRNTNIVLGFDNLVKSATISEKEDDIYTVLNVSGAENLTIAKINPNGTKKLFCLDYYTGVLDKNATNYYENYNEWISDNALKKKVLEWEKASKEAIYDKSSASYGGWTSLQKKFNLLLLTQQSALNQMQTYYDAAQQNMSLYTDYSDIDKLLVQTNNNQLIEYGEAKKKGATIKDYYQVRLYTTDSTYRVTLYAYWKNYAQACESNLTILKEGGKLYSVRAEDFQTSTGDESTINPDYNASSDATILKTGDNLETDVKNHSVTPSASYQKYSINAIQTEITRIQSERDKIVAKYSFDMYFTNEEKIALDPFLIEGSFSDDSFIVTDSMQTDEYSSNSTKVQVIDSSGHMVIKTVLELKQDDTLMDDIYVAQQLVDAGYKKLKVVSQPSFSFSLESTNFLFIEKFQPFIDQLTTLEKQKGSLFGAILNVQLEDDNWVYPYLQEIEINYDNPDSFTMSFGNRFRMSSDAFTFAELHNETSSAVSNVGSLLSAISQPVTNGTIDAVTAYTKEALVATNQSLKATDDNEFVFGSYGIKGRQKSLADDNVNGFSPEQLWITNNKICFTTDGWKTTKAVFGKLTVDGVDTYGLIADTLVGKLIMGNNLIIANSANTFRVDENGLIIENDNMAIKMNPTSGIDILKKVGSGNESVFSVDGNGNLRIVGGSITVGDGANVGYIIDGNNGVIESVLKDKDNKPYFKLTKDGHMEVSNLAIGGTDIDPKPPTPETPGFNGVVQDSGEGLSGNFFEAVWTLLTYFWLGPYVTILNIIGRTDNDGWRKIWGYWSSRTSGATILKRMQDDGMYVMTRSTTKEDIDEWSGMSLYVGSKISDNNDTLDKVYIKQTKLNEYKPWNNSTAPDGTQIEGTLPYLKANYYTQSEVNTKFSDLKTILGVTDADRLTWKTVTINGQSYTVLTK